MASTREAWNEGGESKKGRKMGWKELYLKEDWWAIWLGIGLMLFAIVMYQGGTTAVLKSLTINPGGLKWTSLDQVGAHLSANANLYFYQLIFWLVLFGVSTSIMGVKLTEFIPSFVFLYVMAWLMFAIAGWANAAKFNMEAPLLALIIGLVVANAFHLPKWLDSAFRVEYFIKLGIVLLGATFPITLVLTAGPVAIGQATLISLVTCLTIFFVATRLRPRPTARGGDRRGRFGVRRVRLDGDLGLGRRQEGAPVHVGDTGRGVGADHDPGVAVHLTGPRAAPGCSRRLDWHLGVCGRRRLRRRQCLWQDGRQRRRGDQGLHPHEGDRPRHLDRHLVDRLGGHRDRGLGDQGDRPQAERRRDLVALSEVRARVLRGLDPDDRGHERLQHRGVQQHGETEPDPAADVAAHLGVHLLLPEHRSHDSLPRAARGGLEDLLGLHHRRRRERGARLPAVRARFRRLLVEPVTRDGMRGVMRSCGTCAHFADDPAVLERAIPGLNILSSAFGSVRDETGLCRRRDAFVMPSYYCQDFQNGSSSKS